MRKIIIAGSRSYNHTKQDMLKIFDILSRYYDFENMKHIGEGLELVSGCCPSGPDQIPFIIEKLTVGIEVKKFPANWNPDGVFDPAAGFKRNKQMALYADELIVLFSHKTSGTQNMMSHKKHLEKMHTIINKYNW